MLFLTILLKFFLFHNLFLELNLLFLLNYLRILDLFLKLKKVLRK